MGTNAFNSIGKAARQMNIPIRIFYVSNAPLAWGGKITPGFRANVNTLPYDELSLYLATYGGGGSMMRRKYWIYVAANAHEIGDRMANYYYNGNGIMWDKIQGNEIDVASVRLPKRRTKPQKPHFKTIESK